MTKVELLNTDQIRARRAEVLARAGLPEDELRARAASYALTREQAALLEDIDDLDYLLSA